MDQASQGPRLTSAALRSHLLLFLVVLLLNLWLFRYFLITLATAASIAILMNPLYERFAEELKGRRSVAAALAVTMVALVLIFPVVGYGTLLVEQAVTVFAQLRPYLEPETLSDLWSRLLPEKVPWLRTLQEWLGATELDGALARVTPAVANLASGANQLLQSAVTGLTTAILYLILFLVALFFLLRDGRQFAGEVARLLPFSELEGREIFTRLALTVKGVLYSMVLVPIAQGLLAILGFWIFGLPSAFFWGTLVIFVAAIPGIGSPLVWVPAGIYLLVASAWWRGVGLLLYGTFIISIADNVIKPMLLHGTARMHTFLAFLSILGGLLTFGPAGLLLGPVLFSLLLSMVRIRREQGPDAGI